MSLIAIWRTQPHGTAQLQAAIANSGILEKLKIYMPMLVGAHALEIALDDEPVQMLAEAYALESFQQHAETAFRKSPRFQLVEKNFAGKPAMVLRFKHEFSFEVIAQPSAIADQPLFLETAAMAKVIQSTPEPHQTILALSLARQQQPELELPHLFAQHFGMAAENASKELLRLLESDDNEIRKFIAAQDTVTTATA